MHHLALMNQRTNKHLTDAQGRFKHYFNQPVCNVPTSRPRQCFFINRPYWAGLAFLMQNKLPMSLQMNYWLVLSALTVLLACNPTCSLSYDMKYQTQYLSTVKVSRHPNEHTRHNHKLQATKQNETNPNTQQSEKRQTDRWMTCMNMQSTLSANTVGKLTPLSTSSGGMAVQPKTTWLSHRAYPNQFHEPKTGPLKMPTKVGTKAPVYQVWPHEM